MRNTNRHCEARKSCGNLNRILSIILAAILLLGVLPLTAFAADVDTAETGVTKITAVSFINVPVPVIGQTPQYAVTLGTTGCHVDTSFDDKTRINGVTWTDKTDDVAVKPTDTFQAGHKYSFNVIFTADTGYQFAVKNNSPDVSVTFDGKSASGTNTVVNTEPSETFSTWYVFPELQPTVITAVSFINVPVPVIGQTPQYAVTLGTTGCHVDTSFDDNTTINGVSWTDKTDHVAVKPTDTFQAGHRYAYGVRITADTGYEFAVSGDWPDVSVTFDGKSASGTNPIVNTEPSKTFNTWYTFPELEPIVISSASFYNVPAPKIGQTPQYTVSTDSSVYHVDTSLDDSARKNGVRWSDATDNCPMMPTDTFKAGHKYNFNVIFTADTGYQFAVKNNSPDVSVTFDGYAGSGTNTVYQREPSETMCAWYTFSLENYAAVTFDPNGGSGEMEPEYVKKGSTYTLPECTFTPPSGKVFDRWAVNGTISFGTITTITVKEDTVLEAIWKNAPSGSYAITGAVKSFLSDTDQTTVVLSKKSGDTYALKAIRTVTGKSGQYGFTGLSNGAYKLTVRKKNHVTREYSVTVLLGSKTQDVEINPIGDANLNGKVQANDAMMVYQHAQGKADAQLTGYAFLCADVAPVGNPNGKVQAADAMMIYQQAQGKHSLY